MSVSKWRYTEECNGRPCPGDCDHCSFEPADPISRAKVIVECFGELLDALPSADATQKPDYSYEADMVKRLRQADAVQGEWIPCGEKMPKELERVNVTWLNHNPPFYYQHIKDIPQTDTAVYYRGKWYWWDATVIDVLAEYGEDCNAEQIDKDIEVVAWMPLPTPYKGGDDE